MSEGVCVFDYNNDDLDDILFTTRNGGSLYLYRNQGDKTFSDVSFESNIGMMMEARTAVAVIMTTMVILMSLLEHLLGLVSFFRTMAMVHFKISPH